MDELWRICAGLFLFHLLVGKYNYRITLDSQPGGCAVDADFSLFPFGSIGFETGAIVDVQDSNLLEGKYIRRFHQPGINSDASFVIDVCTGNPGAVDLAFQHVSHLVFPLYMLINRLGCFRISIMSSACFSVIFPFAREIGTVWRPGSR